MDFFAPEEWHMYQMNPAPERKDLQEYISDYCRSHDDIFLMAFLHYYEETLNQNVLSYMRRFFMMEHFSDMKQAYLMGLLKALKHYDIEQGAKFTSFKERYVEREILNYVRSTRTGFTAQSLAEYAKLRKAMAIWDRYDRDYSDETLMAVANELGENVTATQEILLGGLLNEHQAESIGNISTATVWTDWKKPLRTVPPIPTYCMKNPSYMTGSGRHSTSWNMRNGRCFRSDTDSVWTATAFISLTQVTLTKTVNRRRSSFH